MAEGLVINNRRLTRSALTEEMHRILELLRLDGSRHEHDDDDVSTVQVLDDRVLTPSNQFNTFVNTNPYSMESSTPSPDELIIRQRGRKKLPTNVSWSPIKRSPMKTPTKKISAHHLSLLSPSPSKKLNMSSPMVLRSTPKKRLMLDSSMPTTSSTPSKHNSCQTPSKRIKYEERSLNAGNHAVSLNTLLMGLSNNQLIDIISDLARTDPEIESHIRSNLPMPDIRPMEEQLSLLKKNITKSSPRSRLLSKTDGNAFSRAAIHIAAFKKSIFDHCKTLYDSQHFDALLDYVKVSWNYVKSLPKWDNDQNNVSKRDCFKILTTYAKMALKSGGTDLGKDRLEEFNSQIKLMIIDFEDINKCQEPLNNLLKIMQSGYNC